MKNKNPKKPLNKYIRLTGIGFQMGITIYLAAYLGKWLDVKYPNDNHIYTTVITLSGVALALYSLIMQIKNIDK